VRAADVFAEFGENIEMLKKLVQTAIGRVAVERTCTQCLTHAGVTLPFELP
jgi:5'-methylthioadenosine phosphorylase